MLFVFFYRNLNYNCILNNLTKKKIKSNILLYDNLNTLNLFSNKKTIKKKNLLFFFKFLGKSYYSFFYFNCYLIKNFFNIVDKFHKNFNLNSLFIDSDNHVSLPLYNYLFGFKNIYTHSKFFFLKKSFLTQNNWIFLYSRFLKKFNIKILIFMDYLYFRSFFKLFLNFNLPILSIVTQKYEPLYLDYYFIVSYENYSYIKLFTYNLIINTFFKSYNYNFYLIKKKYFFFLNKINLNKV